MTTLIIERDKKGKAVHRCDARCYSAKGKICECVCQGVNHGVGYAEAVTRVIEITPDQLKAIRQSNRYTISKAKSLQLVLLEVEGA